MGYEDTLPLNVAAVWKEGKVTGLGLGTYSVSDFDNFADGPFSVNDGLLSLGGATVKAVLYTASGLRVAETAGSMIDLRGLGRGLYVVKAFRADGSPVSAKILL